MAAYAKDLNTAETAYAAIDEVCTEPFVTITWAKDEDMIDQQLYAQLKQLWNKAFISFSTVQIYDRPYIHLYVRVSVSVMKKCSNSKMVSVNLRDW